MADTFLALQIIAEQKIQEAIEEGAFESLPGQGQPLQLEDMSNVPEELRMAYKILKNSGCIPEELAQRKEMEKLADLLDDCREEKEKLSAIRRLKWLLDKANLESKRNAALEANDEYYHRVLAKLERHQKDCSGMFTCKR